MQPEASFLKPFTWCRTYGGYEIFAKMRKWSALLITGAFSLPAPFPCWHLMYLVSVPWSWRCHCRKNNPWVTCRKVRALIWGKSFIYISLWVYCLLSPAQPRLWGSFCCPGTQVSALLCLSGDKHFAILFLSLCFHIKRFPYKCREGVCSLYNKES